jgi:serine protease
MKRLSILLTFVVTFTLLFATPVAAEEEYAADEVVVQFKTGTKANVIQNIMNLLNLTKVRDSWKAGKFTVFRNNNPDRPLLQLITALLNETSVVKAEKNYIAHAVMVPNDPYYSYQWHMSRIGMENAWDESTGAGVTVAIVDTGVKQSLADLAQTNFVSGYDFVNSDSDPTDDHGHGSHVCGTVAQSTNNSVGVTGIAYNCSIMPVKVLNASGSGTYTQIADGIYWAVDHGADIINMSLGGSSSNSTLQNACNYAWNNGVVVVCAAGNSNSSSPFYPAAYTVCISVSAINSADGKASYSNYGSTIDICGPGGDDVDRNGDGYIDGVLQNTFDSSGDGYFFYYGTSMASPHVAGVAALVWAINPSLTNAEVRNILETTAEDLGAAGWDQYFGNGLVDAYAACVEAGGEPDITPPVISNVQAVDITHNSARITWTTDEPATSVVYYGLTTGYGNTESVGGYTTSHSVTLTGLTSETLYHYKVESTDPSSNTSQSGDYTFTTAEAPVTPEMYVFDISMQKNTFWILTRASATITIKDTNGNFVSNATVYTSWTGKWTGTRSGTTNANGQVTLTTPWCLGSGTFTVTVTNVTHATLTYNPALNNETSDSI